MKFVAFVFASSLLSTAPAFTKEKYIPSCDRVDEHFIALLEEEVGRECVSGRYVIREEPGIVHAGCKFRGFSMSYRFECEK
jgi:hypothetical protein